MPAQGAPGNWVDPYRSYNFKLEIRGVTQGHFTSCDGLEVKVQDIKYREGGANQIVHRIPGQVDYGNCTLSYGLTQSNELWQWFMKTVDGTVERKNVSIVMLGNDGVTPGMRWDLIDTWPSQWRGAPLDALGREIAIESMTLVFSRLNRG